MSVDDDKNAEWEDTFGPDYTDDTELWNADPKCEHDIQPASGGGVKCTKCAGWFCF